MRPCECVSLVTGVACAIANSVPIEELPLIASILGELANTLTTITVINALNNPKAPALPEENVTPDTEIITVPRQVTP